MPNVAIHRSHTREWGRSSRRFVTYRQSVVQSSQAVPHKVGSRTEVEYRLREAGFSNVRVTSKTGDGGIDGVGVYRISLVSFHVFFQCKRYAGSVGSAEVRNFRGAMAGRGDRGLLITTGTYTASAQAEATRDGAHPVDLIDGDARQATCAFGHRPARTTRAARSASPRSTREI